jgi:hypothetical protein
MGYPAAEELLGAAFLNVCFVASSLFGFDLPFAKRPFWGIGFFQVAVTVSLALSFYIIACLQG